MGAEGKDGRGRGTWRAREAHVALTFLRGQRLLVKGRPYQIRILRGQLCRLLRNHNVTMWIRVGRKEFEVVSLENNERDQYVLDFGRVMIDSYDR